ncbi:MAG: hypothetical protein PHW03_06740 [Eubacteriales bacterium]|nr:hypothetical protein [Eubacteriales bacterium]MDD4390483.1 hypothetical protein [Eubacteriales bacterium]
MSKDLNITAEKQSDAPYRWLFFTDTREVSDDENYREKIMSALKDENFKIEILNAALDNK